MPAVRKTKLMQLVWKWPPRIYRATGGRVLGSMMGLPVLLLNTRGRKSGAPRTSALMYLPEGGAAVVVGSYAGEPRHPDWWLNLLADPHGTVQRGRTVTAIVAREAEGTERERLWNEFVRRDSGYAEYARRTTRRIPVVVLQPERR